MFQLLTPRRVYQVCAAYGRVDIRHYPKTDVVVNGWSVKFSKAEETTEQVRTSALVIILLPTL